MFVFLAGSQSCSTNRMKRYMHITTMATYAHITGPHGGNVHVTLHTWNGPQFCIPFKNVFSLSVAEDQFRLLLVDLEKENMGLKSKVSQMESLVDDLNGDKKNLERKVRYLEKEAHDLRSHGSDLKRRRQELESQVWVMEWMIMA